MNDPDELYESVLERLGDGLGVDWEALEKRCPELTARWRGLRQVQEISSAFQHVRETPEASVLPADTPDPPLRWGTLHLREKIGEGSFAEVYRAHDPVLERDVALKLARGAGHQRFLDEGRRLAQIDHPGVTRVHGAAVHDGRAGVWMDLATGRCLDQRLAQDGRFSEIEVIDIARQLSSALSAVHGAGLVHGDIKAANVLRRDGGEIVLGDFGSSIDPRVGPTEPISATPLNAAPEILRGESADARSDIYSLGVLLFNLLTGTFPFEGESVAAIQTAHRDQPPARLRDQRPDISSALAPLVDRTVAVDPAERFQNAREFGDAIERLTQLPTGHGSPRFGPRPWLWAALLGAGLFGAVLLGWFANKPPENHADPMRVGLFRTGDAVALQTGDPVDVGDALHLRIEGNGAPLWLYLINEDAQGRVYQLFPLTGVQPSNPLPPGDLRLPGRISGVEQDWVVTSEGRTESFLLVASRAPLPELESALAEIEGASADRAPQDSAHQDSAPQDSATLALPTRGVGGLEASALATAPGTLIELRQIALASSSGRIEIVTLRGGPVPR